VLLILCSSTVFAAGGNNGGSYFSGPGRSPSYGSKAIAAGFGSGNPSGTGQNVSNQSTGGGSGQTCGCGQTASNNPGHH
jgi:hypothetical protein